MQQARSPYLNRIIFYLLIFLVAFCSISFCAELEDPIRNGGGARPLGIGRAATALLDDINAAYYNPAGLGTLKAAEFTGMYYSKVYGNYHYFVSAGATNMDWGIIGLGFLTSGTGQIPITIIGTDPAYAEYADNLIFVTYARSLQDIDPLLSNVYFGTNLKFFSKGTTGALTYMATGTNIDVGLKYIPYPWLSLGLNKQNALGGYMVWNTGTSEAYPSPLFLGAAMKNEKRRETYSFDIEIPSSPLRPTLYHLGYEYQADQTLQLRAGLDAVHDAGADKIYWNPCAGVGFILKGLTIDYAFHPYYGDPGYASHFVSMSFVGEYKSDIRAIAGTPDKRSFYGGETVGLTVKMPFEAANVVAEAPDKARFDLNYYHPDHEWRGSWTIPSDFKPEAYNFKIIVADYNGYQVFGSSNDFFILPKIVTPEAIVTEEAVITQEAAATPEARVLTEMEVALALIEQYCGKKIEPESLVTRRDVAAIISNAKDYELTAEATEITSLYKDVDSNTLDAKYILACYKYRSLIGFIDKTFRPDINFKVPILIAMISNSEADKQKKAILLQHLDKIDPKKVASFSDLVDVAIAIGYLKEKYPQVQIPGTINPFK